jgi:hypothetical protein
MTVLNSEEARKIAQDYIESKKFRDYMKSFTQLEQNKMHNIFGNVKKAAMQGDNSIIVDVNHLTESMLDFINFLGYEVRNSELTW